ncbi:MAG TPA: HAD-IC family P-type ATPase, partial [Pseudodesulfovibrio sp.]|nr:HAD-IC family P-type ATPase [Pseudodesulfovibrio sp.]
GRSLLIRFGTAAFLSLQLMMYSIALYGGYFKGMDQGTREILQYFAALVATPVVFFAGAPFLKSAWRSLLNRSPNMDLLIALGVLTAYCYSLGALLFGGEVYFETAAMIVTLLLLGRLLESRARKKAMAGIDRLLNLTPDTARLVTEGRTVVVASSQLKTGDIIEVGPGDRFPVDGTLLDAETEVDESVLTGEATPILRKPGETILSGAMNISTAIRIRVEQTASQSFMARINHMVEEAQNRRAPVQGLADRVAGLFVPAVILVALATGIYWAGNGAAPATALMYSVSVLVVACPCALGLATPTAILAGTGVAAAGGILFRGGDTLETTARLSLAAFDKTGTLTDSIPQVVAVVPVESDRATLLALAARAETGSNHPLARGIIKLAESEGIHVTSQGGVIVPGRGVRTKTEQGELLAGSRSFMEDNGIALPSAENTA